MRSIKVVRSIAVSGGARHRRRRHGVAHDSPRPAASGFGRIFDDDRPWRFVKPIVFSNRRFSVIGFTSSAAGSSGFTGRADVDRDLLDLVTPASNADTSTESSSLRGNASRINSGEAPRRKYTKT